jgi:endonuclease/exonuclease/phosphatase family metal-dependent hydrolase
MKPLHLPACLALSCFLVGSVRAEVIAYWHFNSQPADANLNTGSLAPALGSGTAATVGSVSASFTAANGSSDSAADNSNWRITGWPAQGTGNKSHGVRFALSTVGLRRIRIEFDLRASNTASRYIRLQYTTNGTAFLDHAVVIMPPETWVNRQTVTLDGVPGVENNPLFGVRLVTEFEHTATGTGALGYVAANTGSTYGTSGTLRWDLVIVSGDPISPDPACEMRLVNYNVWGGDATNWTAATPQVQAIGRQLALLAPDVVTLQEIPDLGLSAMPAIVGTYLPGFFLATNRVSDGSKGSLILSRWPILRSTSHLGRSSLAAWGYDGVFTRDLFEAEIAVPGWSEPMHAFTVHLKAFNDAESGPRRAAEANAVSNHLVNVFLPAHGHRPYLLAGDCNEDIARPRSYEQGAMLRLINAQTGLQLTTPRDPFTSDERTWSSRNPSPTIRFDYVLPGGLLSGQLRTNWIFRTDRLQPLPGGLLANDTQTASDHLPLVMEVANPYRLPTAVPATVQADAATVILSWASRPGDAVFRAWLR